MSAFEAQAHAALKPSRVDLVDLMRGLVIVLMALDHVRDYFHVSGWSLPALDPDQSNPALYLTRWITHLCAPTFVLLAGVSAFLQSAQGKPKAALARLLLTRGLFLVVLELTLIGFAWSFAAPYAFLIQVIWAIGWSMVLLAGVVWLPLRAVLALGLAIVVGHNLLDPIEPAQFGGFAQLWHFTHQAGPLMLGDLPIGYIAYPVLPWFGITCVGYGVGGLFLKPATDRDRVLLIAGIVLLAAFALLRGFNLYGDPRAWTAQADLTRTLMDVFNVQKYPPSLDYVCVTLGLMCLIAPVLARLPRALGGFLRTFGAVPLFAYVLHIYVLHTLAIIAAALAGQPTAPYFGFMANVFAAPDALAQNGFPLWVAYIAWLIVLAILYPLCRWFAGVKRTRKDWWLSYL
jgi:uncharacterized membrane protein